MADHITLGKAGEGAAIQMLRSNGYRILGHNVKACFGELDVVAQEGGVLCFVEVKTRRELRFGFPEEGVTPEKQRRIKRLAQWYLRSHRWNRAVRFDVVSVWMGPDGSIGRLRLIKGAFE